MGKAKKSELDAHAERQTHDDSKKSAKQTKGKAPPAAAATPAATATGPAADQQQPSSKKRAAKDEIDAIFAAKKKPASEEPSKPADETSPELQQLAAEVGVARQAAQAAGKRPKVEGSKDDIFGEQTGKSRKRTEEGYAVYSEEELGLGKRGGDTALCPFDCECCF